MSLVPKTVHMDTKHFRKCIRKKTKHGFSVYVYISADDSKHFKHNRHVLLLSNFEEDNPELDYISVPCQPNFWLVTTSPNEVKTYAYLKNADDIIDMIELDGAAQVGGGTNDNEGEACLILALYV